MSVPTPGRIVEIPPHTGSMVAAGDVVARLEQPELRQEHDEATKIYGDLVDQRRQVDEFQKIARDARDLGDRRRRNDLEQSAGLIRKRLAYLRERASIDEDLGSRRLITRAQTVDTRVAMGVAEEELATVDRQINEIGLNAVRQGIQERRELLELDLKIDAAARHVAAVAERRQQAEQVISPHGGTVVELKQDVGGLAAAGAALMTILPDATGQPRDRAATAPVRVVLFVPGGEGKRIRPGMTVEVTPSSVRREEHGFMFARVMQVSEVPVTVEGMFRVLKNQQLATTLSAGGAPFAVDVELQRADGTPSGFVWSSAPGPATVVIPGTLAAGRVWIRRLRLIEFAIPATRTLFSRDFAPL